MEDLNEKWAKQPYMKDRKCKLCGRGVLETKLNFEAAVHHNSPVTCLDQKACRRYRRKHPQK